MGNRINWDHSDPVPPHLINFVWSTGCSSLACRAISTTIIQYLVRHARPSIISQAISFQGVAYRLIRPVQAGSRTCPAKWSTKNLLAYFFSYFQFSVYNVFSHLLWRKQLMSA